MPRAFVNSITDCGLEVTYDEERRTGRGLFIGQHVGWQSWLYFDQQRMIPMVKRWLKPGGKLVLTYLSWLPRKDPIAQATERLILQYNPQWSDADFPREHDALRGQIAPDALPILHQIWFHAYTPIGDADTMHASPS